MSLPPPNGYGIASLTFQRVGTPKTAVITCGFQNATALTAAACNTRWRAATMVNANTPFLPTNMFVGWSVVQSYILLTSAGGLPTADTITTPVVGTRAGLGLPVNTSVVVPKTVALVGRQYRGRILFPPTYLATSAVDQDGNITPAQVTALQATVTQMHAGMTGNSMPPVLLHQPPQGGGATPIPTPITAFTIRPRIGTIRHRIRR